MYKSRGKKEYMAYVAEGLGSSQDLNEIMKFQKADGSILNSPSTTAFLLTQNYDDKSFKYLISLLQQVGSSGTFEFFFFQLKTSVI
jgi:ent-kaurene synthase